MRVIAGVAKGTRLFSPKGKRVRPVLDRVKESLFGILGDTVEGAVVLDLFAGAGLLGIEALSRGASRAVFVEKHGPTARYIRYNLERAHLGHRAEVIVSSLPAALGSVKGRYSLIFIDPPFRIESRLLEEVFGLIDRKGLLDEDGLLVYRHNPRSHYTPPADVWSMVDRRGYGDSIISIFRLRG